MNLLPSLSCLLLQEEKIKTSNKTPIPTEFQFLLDMNFPNFFEQLGIAHELKFRCKGCGEEVKQWDREEHFNDHKRDRGMFLEASRIAANLAREEGTGDTRTDVCVNCGEAFTQERKRGRPRKQCYDCLSPK